MNSRSIRRANSTTPSTCERTRHPRLCNAAAERLFDRRERLEKHEEEPLTLLSLSVSEIDAIIDSFYALEAAHGLTLDERVLRDDLIDWIEGTDVAESA